MKNFEFAKYGLALAGLLMLAGLLLRGSPVPASDAELFYATVSQSSYSLAWWVIIASTLPQIFGFVFLYGRLSAPDGNRLALWAMVLAVSGTALQIGLYVINSFVAVSIAAQHQIDAAVTADVYYGIYAGGLGQYLAVFGLFNLAGLFLFAAAIFRANWLPGWVGLLLVAQYFGLLTPALGIRGVTSLAIESSGAVLLIVAGLIIARRTTAVA